MAEIALAQVREAAIMFFLNRGVQPLEKPPSSCTQLRVYHPPIIPLPLPYDETRILHPVEQTCHVGHARDHPVPDFIAAKPGVPSALKNPQYVVLCAGNPRRPKDLLKPVAEYRAGAHYIQLRLLRKAAKRFLLFEFVFQIGFHCNRKTRCYNT